MENEHSKTINRKHGKIILYQSKDGQAAMDVCLADDTVWLTLNQMSELFERDKSVISRHLRNIFQTDELEKQSTVAKNATVQMIIYSRLTNWKNNHLLQKMQQFRWKVDVR